MGDSSASRMLLTTVEADQLTIAIRKSGQKGAALLANRPGRQIVEDVLALYAAWKAGALGGEVMPEDVYPRTAASLDELAAYFTLGMCLNYQRNSYALWRACTSMFDDPQTRWAFDMGALDRASPGAAQEALLRHKVALQPNRHPQIWTRVAAGFNRHGNGSVQRVFEASDFDLVAVREFVTRHRSDFPYLCGPKIANYWLYVMSSYLDWPFTGRSGLTVAPDRHVIAASLRLGLITDLEATSADAPHIVAACWTTLLAETSLTPIDMHTPLWLWSRAGFPDVGL